MLGRIKFYRAHKGNVILLSVYLTLRLVSLFNNPHNSEMKICENMKVNMLKIIIIIIGYTLNNFTTHMTILY
jgi:hypothetical protein